MTTYARGGVVDSSWSATVVLADDECVFDRDGRCVRDDERHGYAWTEVRRLGRVAGIPVRGRCLHRPCRVVPVESVVTGEIIARLCRTCDAQLMGES